MISAFEFTKKLKTVLATIKKGSISHDVLTTITVAFTHVKNELHLAAHNIENEEAIAMCPIFGAYHILTALDLSDNALSSEGFNAIVNSLPDTLESLIISNNKLDDACDLGLLLTKCPKLKKLCAPLNKLGDNSMVSLAMALISHKHLETLELLNNTIESKGYSALLKSLPPSLTNISIGGTETSQDAANAISNGLYKCTSSNVSELDVSGICAKNAVELSKGIGNFKSLSSLSLSSCDFSNEALLSSFISNLCTCHTIRKLSLANCKITDQGGYIIAKLIKSTSLEELALHVNKVRDPGLAAIAKALRLSNSIRVLQVDSNSLTDEGVSELAEALKKNTSIEELSLSQNYITDVGALVLAKVIAERHRISVLNLSWNEIEDATDIKNTLANVESLSLTITDISTDKSSTPSTPGKTA